MIVPVMAISNLVLTQQIYSEETNGVHEHYREPVSLSYVCDVGHPGGGGVGAHRKMPKTPLKLPESCFIYLFPPLRGTNLTCNNKLYNWHCKS